MKTEYEFTFNRYMTYFITAKSEQEAKKKFDSIFPSAENVTIKETKQVYEVYMCASGIRYVIFEGTEEECNEFCENHNWVFLDENDFEWNLEIDD